MKFIRRLFNKLFGSRPKVWGTDIVVGRPDSAKLMDIFSSDFDGVVTLTEENATKANIDYALQWLDEREDSDTEVLIYYSGHGGSINNQPPLDEADQPDELLGVVGVIDTQQFTDHILDNNFKNQLANFGGDNDNETIHPT